MQNLKTLSDEELAKKKMIAVGAEERARVRFAKDRSSKNGEKYKKARELAGALRTESRLRENGNFAIKIENSILIEPELNNLHGV